MMRSAVVTLALGAVLFPLGRYPDRPSGHHAFGPSATAGATITGRVTSLQTGAPLANASVMLEGVRIGATTGADGRYTLAVPASRVHGQRAYLVARRIGFQQRREPIVLRAGARDTVNFALRAQAMRLSEVVVSGAATTAEAGRYTDAFVGRRGAAYASMARSRSMLPQPAPVQSAIRTADELVIVAQSSGASGDGSRAVTQGTLRARDADGDVIGEFPLEHTDVSAQISGRLAQTTVEQRYTNPFERTIEAVYVFPLPTMAAVNDFVMRVGERRIVGIVRPRAEAERTYREARARGQTASLLTEERPNIFTQSVANIEPGGTVTISITYFETLPYEHGRYEYVFPMVVGPRYIPGHARRGPILVSQVHGQEQGDGGGWAPPTDRVPDADRITPPVLKPGQRSGHDIALTVSLDAGLPITSLQSVAHQVEIERPSASRNIIRLAHGDSIPNRDFVLRWSVAGAETRFGVLAHRDTTGGYFTLMMQPPLAPSDEQVTPREITFIVDVSGSMMGTPIAIAKDVVTRTLDRLRPADRFNLVYFASGNAQLWDHARPGTPENVAEAKRFLERLDAGGGTEMLAGVRRALAARHDPAALQMFVFLTDGYVGDDDDILRVVTEERGDARFFAFGIGSSVNRYLIDGIGEYGGGASYTVLPRDPEHTESAVGRLFDAIDSPVLVDVGIDWNGLPVEDVYPGTLRDLFAGQTINVIGRYTRGARGIAYVTGRIGDRRVRYPVRVDLPDAEAANPALAPTWARAKIHDLSTTLLAAGDEAERHMLEQRITDVALRFHLVSRYTAFVAVDESRIVGDGRPIRVMQPVELPEGVSYEGVFGGERPVGVPMRIGSWGLDVQGTEQGHIRIGTVVPGGAAAKAGARRGAVVTRVNGVAVHDVDQLERVLLQSGGTRVRVEVKHPPSGVGHQQTSDSTATVLLLPAVPDA